jgi:hypothetical protein
MMTGSLPSTIGMLSDLRYLAIVSTSIGGPLPSEIGLLQNVLNLNLENNLFSGEIPSRSFAGMNALSKCRAVFVSDPKNQQSNVSLYLKRFHCLFSQPPNQCQLPERHLSTGALR